MLRGGGAAEHRMHRTNSWQCPSPVCREYKERLAAAQNQPPQPMEAQEADQPPMLPITGAWVGDVFLLSCCAWQAATLLSDFLAPR